MFRVPSDRPILVELMNALRKLKKEVSIIVRPGCQDGFGLLEAVVAISILSIVGLAILSSAVNSYRFHKYTEVGLMAKNLAVSKAEELSGIAIDQLTDTYDGSESNVAVSGHAIKFSRLTNITVNSDGSRTIDITVSTTSPYLPTPVHYQTRFAPWEA